jgi:adenosylcobinamide kinase/adenosylcobinamide-phosphate guanylyltransferase
MPAKIVLVTGGARSGKSEFAEKYVLHYGAKCAYIATAEILDEEMAERVRLHKARRHRTRWINFEAPYNAHEVLCEAAQEADVVLFDCLTLYMSNLLYGKNAPQGTTEEKAQVVKAEIAKLIEVAEAGGKITVFVTNEVGAGIVPENAMAREYRDIAGWVNQQVADAADSVFYCVAGQAVDMKKLAFKFEEE